jgi:hypothetical protein
MTDPTPTTTPLPAAPDWRALCKELLQPLAEYDDANPYHDHRDLITRTRAALATPPAPSLEPRGCPTPGACSCPAGAIVPPELIRALELAEAALADIGDADREPGDDIAWAEHRAAEDLPRVRHALETWRDHATPPAPPLEPRGCPTAPMVPRELIRALELAEAELVAIGDLLPGAGTLRPRISRALLTWREHATPPAATREAGPLPQAGAEIITEEWDALKERLWDQHETVGHQGERCMWFSGFDAALDEARAVLARWGGVAVQPVPVSERPWERPGWCDAGGYCWRFDPCENGWWSYGAPLDLMGSPSPWTHMLPHWALPVPAAAAGEVQP